MKKIGIFKGPKSLCVCGHAGDGPNGQHADRCAPGHGPCLMPGCGCTQFTWMRYTPAFEKIREQCALIRKVIDGKGGS